MASPRNYGLFPGTAFPAKGEQKALVLLVEFSNVEFFTEDAQVYFDRMLNSDGYNIGGLTGAPANISLTILREYSLLSLMSTGR